MLIVGKVLLVSVPENSKIRLDLSKVPHNWEMTFQQMLFKKRKQSICSNFAMGEINLKDYSLLLQN